MIAGIVLAAGQSRRMGRPKALLTLDGVTFVERAVLALARGGCSPVVLVVGPEDHSGTALVAELARARGAEVVANPVSGSEQVDSLRAGLRALADGVEAAVVLPVDVPSADADAVRRVVDGFRRGGCDVVRAVHGGRHGHPVLFGRGVFAELLADGLPEGARTVIHRDPARVREVEVPHPGVLRDVDTPEDYRLLLVEEPG